LCLTNKHRKTQLQYKPNGHTVHNTGVRISGTAVRPHAVLSLLLDRNSQLSLVQRHHVMQLASTDYVELCHSGTTVSRLTRRSLYGMQDRDIHLYHTLVILWTQKRVLSCCLSAEAAMTAAAVCRLCACDALRCVGCKRPGQLCQAASMQNVWCQQ